MNRVDGGSVRAGAQTGTARRCEEHPVKCPKCTGFLAQEDIQEHSGHFQGWRCIQCGLRLDQTIVHNRIEGPAEPVPDPDEEAPSVRHRRKPAKTPPRTKRAVRAS